MLDRERVADLDGLAAGGALRYRSRPGSPGSVRLRFRHVVEAEVAHHVLGAAAEPLLGRGRRPTDGAASRAGDQDRGCADLLDQVDLAADVVVAVEGEEFSWLGWQSFSKFGGKTARRRRARSRRTRPGSNTSRRACPSRGGPSLDRFDAAEGASTRRSSASTTTGSGRSRTTSPPSRSLTGYRALRLGTQRRPHHHRPAQLPLGGAERAGTRPTPLFERRLPELRPQEALEILDAGRAYAGGRPPATIRFGDERGPELPEGRSRPRRSWAPSRRPGSSTGCARSTATWKVWGNSPGHARLARRSAEPAAGPRRSPGPARATPRSAAATTAPPTPSAREIYDLVREQAITGFATVSGDRHSFWAGLAAKALPPRRSSRSASRSSPARSRRPASPRRTSTASPRTIRCGRCTSWTAPAGAKPDAADQPAAAPRRALVPRVRQRRRPRAGAGASNPRLAPHLSFVDMGGHGYATVRVDAPTRSRPSSSASRGRSSAANGRTAARCATACAHRARAVGRASGRPRAAGRRGRPGAVLKETIRTTVDGSQLPQRRIQCPSHPSTIRKPSRPCGRSWSRWVSSRWTTPEQVDAALAAPSGTVLVIVNSICGCAAGHAAPAPCSRSRTR